MLRCWQAGRARTADALAECSSHHLAIYNIMCRAAAHITTGGPIGSCTLLQYIAAFSRDFAGCNFGLVFAHGVLHSATGFDAAAASTATCESA